MKAKRLIEFAIPGNYYCLYHILKLALSMFIVHTVTISKKNILPCHCTFILDTQ